MSWLAFLLVMFVALLVAVGAGVLWGWIIWGADACLLLTG